MIVPEECAGDRHSAPHDANLFDINAKYGDVMPLLKVIKHIESKQRTKNQRTIRKARCCKRSADSEP